MPWFKHLVILYARFQLWLLKTNQWPNATFLTFCFEVQNNYKWNTKNSRWISNTCTNCTLGVMWGIIAPRPIKIQWGEGERCPQRRRRSHDQFQMFGVCGMAIVHKQSLNSLISRLKSVRIKITQKDFREKLKDFGKFTCTPFASIWMVLRIGMTDTCNGKDSIPAYHWSWDQLTEETDCQDGYIQNQSKGNQ